MAEYELQQQINELKQEIERLKTAGITRDISIEQQDALLEITRTQVQDIFWDEFFYIHEFFDTTTGFTVSSATTTVSFTQGVDLITGSSSGQHKQYGRKTPNSTDFITHDREAYFRTSVTLGETTAQTGYVRTLYDGGYGSLSSLGDDVAYRSAVGFKFKNGNILGCSQADGKESAVQLEKIVADQAFELELRYFPRDRVDFYVNKTFRGSLAENLPTLSENDTSIFESYLQTDEGAQKDMYVEYYEFLQKRR